jgi:hypothetical protein
MRTRRIAGLVVIALGFAGCTGNGLSFRDAFERDKGPDPSKLPPGSSRAATRVVAVGSEVVAQNKSAFGVDPVFFTMGVPEVEISHNKSGVVFLSEGLVERCPTDTELAAVICHELGKLAAEHTPTRGNDADLSPPRIGRDPVGGTYEPDMTRLAEEAKFNRRAPGASRSDRDARPDGRVLGETIFVKTGRKAEDYAKLDQLIKQAEDNADKRAAERTK